MVKNEDWDIICPGLSLNFKRLSQPVREKLDTMEEKAKVKAVLPEKIFTFSISEENLEARKK